MPFFLPGLFIGPCKQEKALDSVRCEIDSPLFLIYASKNNGHQGGQSSKNATNWKFFKGRPALINLEEKFNSGFPL